MNMFEQPFMQHALAMGSIVAVLAGLTGFFVVLRGAGFAAHALGQVGFAGAAGAVLIGVDPLWGLVAFAMVGALGLGALGTRRHGHDAATALILAAALGLGALFLVLTTSYATAAFSLLFGTIVGVSLAQVWQTGALALVCLAALAALFRPLLLATLDPDLAAARGVSVRLVSMLFLLVVGLAAAVTVPTAGTLLIFSLMVGPAAAACALSRRPLLALLLSALFSLLATWVGITLAYATGWPVGFFITALVAAIYLGARAWVWQQA
jgi:zinc/manganese transport system permease protein